MLALRYWVVSQSSGCSEPRFPPLKTGTIKAWVGAYMQMSSVTGSLQSWFFCAFQCEAERPQAQPLPGHVSSLFSHVLGCLVVGAQTEPWRPPGCCQSSHYSDSPPLSMQGFNAQWGLMTSNPGLSCREIGLGFSTSPSSMQGSCRHTEKSSLQTDIFSPHKRDLGSDADPPLHLGSLKGVHTDQEAAHWA